MWNEAFVSALKENCEGTPLLKNIIDHAPHEDPLERNIQIGNCINRCFKNTPKNLKLYKNKLRLNTKNIVQKKKRFKWF